MKLQGSSSKFSSLCNSLGGVTPLLAHFTDGALGCPHLMNEAWAWDTGSCSDSSREGNPEPLHVTGSPLGGCAPLSAQPGQQAALTHSAGSPCAGTNVPKCPQQTCSADKVGGRMITESSTYTPPIPARGWRIEYHPPLRDGFYLCWTRCTF